MAQIARFLPLVKRAAPFALLILIFYFFTHSGKPYADEVILRFKDSKMVFMERYMQEDVLGFSDGSGLEQLCSSKNWHADRVFSCETAKNGLASVRQWELQCIRLAIEAGASTLILPNIIKRKDSDFRPAKRAHAPLTGVPIDYMFDFHHLNDTLAAHCPQMKVSISISDFHDVPSLLTSIDFKLGDVFKENEKDLATSIILPVPEEWAARFDDHIEEVRSKTPSKSRLLSEPYRVRLVPSEMGFPVYSDKPEARHDLSQLLRFRRDARLLAGSALFQLVEKYGVNIDPHFATEEDGFAGIHMRLELDVEEEEGKSVPEFAYQASESVKYVTSTGLKIAFLASGGPREKIDSFIEGSQEFNLTIVTKEMLLEGQDLEQLRGLSYDQQAIVDHEILKRATRMVGIGQSTFSADLAIVRADAYSNTALLKVPEPDNTMMWKDKHTTLFWRLQNTGWVKWVRTWWP